MPNFPFKWAIRSDKEHKIREIKSKLLYCKDIDFESNKSLIWFFYLARNEYCGNYPTQRADTLQTSEARTRESESLFHSSYCFALLLKLLTDTYERKSLCPAWNEGKIREAFNESSKHHPVSFTSKNSTENMIIVMIFWTSCTMTLAIKTYSGISKFLFSKIGHAERSLIQFQLNHISFQKSSDLIQKGESLVFCSISFCTQALKSSLQRSVDALAMLKWVTKRQTM